MGARCCGHGFDLGGDGGMKGGHCTCWMDKGSEGGETHGGVQCYWGCVVDGIGGNHILLWTMFATLGLVHVGNCCLGDK